MRLAALSKYWLFASLPLWLYIILFKSGGSLYYTALPVLGEQVLPIWLVGVLIGASSFVQLVLDVPAGICLDRYGYVRLLRLTSACLSLGGIVLFFFGLQSWTFIVLILMSGFGWLFFGPGVDAYALVMSPPGHAGRFMSIRRLTSSLGTTIAALLFTLLLPFPPRALGLVIGTLLVLDVLVTFFLKPEKQSVHAEKKIETHHYFVRRQVLKDIIRSIRRLNPASGMLAFSGFAGATFYGIVWFALPLYLQEQAQAGPLQLGLAIFDVTVIVCGGFIGKLADTKHKRLFIFLGLCLFAVFSTLVGFHLNGWFLVFGFLASMGDELSCVSLWSWMNHLNRDHAHDGLVASVISFFQDLGWVIGPIIAGLVYVRLGPSWTICLGASFIVFSWIISSIVLRCNILSIFHSPLPASARPHRYPHKD